MTATPKAWRIANWHSLYEVDRYGRAADGSVQEYRQGPLPWVRLRVAGHGHAMGPGYRSLLAVCGDGARAMAAFAVFAKCLEFAADLPRELRGWILDHRHQPAGPADVAFSTGFPVASIEQALADLSDQRVRWIEQVAYSAGVPAPIQAPTDPADAQPVASGCNPAQASATIGTPSRARAGATQPNPTQPNSTQPPPDQPKRRGGGVGGMDSGDQARRVGVVGVMTRTGCTPKQVAQVIEACGTVTPLVLQTEDAARVAGQIAKDQTVRNQAACLTHRLVELATARCRGARQEAEPCPT